MRPSRKKANHQGTGTRTPEKPISERKESYLKKLYTDPSRPGSYSGLNKLKQAIKKDGTYQFTDAQLKTELAKQDSYTVNRFARRKFKRSRVVAYGVNDMVDVDLADFSRLSRYNKKINFLIIAIDVFSRFVKVRPLFNKSAASVVEALESIYPAGSPGIHKIRTDLGLVFWNARVEKFFKRRGIRHVLATPPIKAGYAERCIQSLKQLIYKYLYHNHSFRYIDVLNQLVENYNNRPHRSLGKLSPSEVNETNQVSLWNKLYIDSLLPKGGDKQKKTETKFNFEKGDLVRISFAKSPFERSYGEKFTQEAFTIKDRYLLSGVPVYKLADLQDILVEGVFFNSDLTRVIKTDDLWRVERILKYRGRPGRKQEVLVRWAGFGPKFDSYILRSSLKKYKK